MSSIRLSDLAPKKPYPEPVTILHISDIHFDSKTDINSPKSNAFHLHMRSCLQRCLDSGIEFDIVVVTGDLVNNKEIASKARQLAIANAEKFLLNLCILVKVDPTKGLLVIPGNHDCSWSGSFFGGTYGRILRNEFDRSFGKYCQHTLYRELKLFVACFDSNAANYEFELAKGKVDITAFDKLIEEVSQLPDEYRMISQSAVRIALVHHHPLPIAQAEDLEPSKPIEYLLGRKVAGAPEYMLLRNSGTFLHRLLDQKFRLVLHGHLHKRGYWIPLTYQEEQIRWLEVVSCGSARQPSEGQPYSFNIIKVHTSPGLIETSYVDFGTDGNVPAPKPMVPSTAASDLLRFSLRESQTTPEPDVRIDSYCKRWDVVLPEGDILTTEVIRGMRSIDGRLVPKISMSFLPSLSSEIHMTVRALSGDPGRVRCELSKGSKQITSLQHDLIFNPPLGTEPIDIICHRRTMGALASSRADQKHSGMIDNIAGFEELVHQVIRPADRLLINVRFFARAGWEPSMVTLDVTDAQGLASYTEQNTSAVHWTYSDPRDINRYSDLFEDIIALPEATISVVRPQVGFSYGLRWKLPRVDPVGSSAALNQLRRQLHDHDEHDSMGALVRVLLQEAVDWALREAQKGGSSVRWRKDSIRSYFFSFDSENSRLVCKSRTSVRNDPLAERHYHWGKDIIGTAFRRREPVFYLKRDDDSVGVRLIDLPGAIQAMIAVPVNAPYPDNEWPVAVLVLASFDPDSVLEALLRDKSTAAGLADWISNRSGDLMMVPPESAEPISEPRT